MIQRSCQIVEVPEGGLAALMPLPEVQERHWVAVKEAGPVFHTEGRIHRESTAYRVADRPWEERWRPLGSGDIVVIRPDTDYDIGGGD